VPYVGADYVTATAKLLGRAKSMGHNRIAYVGPKDGAESARDRWIGFSAEGKGTELVLHVPEVGGASEVLLARLRQSEATVVFLTELADAIGIRAAAQSAGLSVPGDLSIVVLGSHIRPSTTGIPFTTFAVPREEMARRATAMLADRIEGGGPGGQVLLECEPVAGETLAPPTRKIGKL
jgi:DNA-binding LacI/PurR family transcriptional regulator